VLFRSGVVRVEKLGQGARTLWRPSKKVPTLSWPLGIAWVEARQELVVSSFGGEGYVYRINGRTGEWTAAQSLNNIDLKSLAFDPSDAQLLGTIDGRRVVALGPSGVPIRAYEALPDVDYLLGENAHSIDHELTLLPAKEGLVILGFKGGRLDETVEIPELRGIWFAPRGSLRPALIWRAPLISP
jgi:hypothetical protein